MKQHPCPKVGDTVILNDNGLEQCFGRKHGLAHMKTLRLKVISVETQSLTFPQKTYPVEVDHPEIGELLTDNWCFDIVTPGV